MIMIPVLTISSTTSVCKKYSQMCLLVVNHHRCYRNHGELSDSEPPPTRQDRAVHQFSCSKEAGEVAVVGVTNLAKRILWQCHMTEYEDGDLVPHVGIWSPENDGAFVMLFIVSFLSTEWPLVVQICRPWFACPEAGEVCHDAVVDSPRYELSKLDTRWCPPICNY